MGHNYTNKSIHFLIWKFNWAPCILSGNPYTHGIGCQLSILDDSQISIHRFSSLSYRFSYYPRDQFKYTRGFTYLIFLIFILSCLEIRKGAYLVYRLLDLFLRNYVCLWTGDVSLPPVQNWIVSCYIFFAVLFEDILMKPGFQHK